MTKHGNPPGIPLPAGWSADSFPGQILPKAPTATVLILTTAVNRMSAEERPPALGLAAVEEASIADVCGNARDRSFGPG